MTPTVRIAKALLAKLTLHEPSCTSCNVGHESDQEPIERSRQRHAIPKTVLQFPKKDASPSFFNSNWQKYALDSKK
jgi:hypothetical protein